MHCVRDVKESRVRMPGLLLSIGLIRNKFKMLLEMEYGLEVCFL